MLATLAVGEVTAELSRTTAADVPALARLLADDDLAASRGESGEDEHTAAYLSAFRAIDRDDAHLLVTVRVGDEIAGTMQLSFLPSLSRRGATRLQIEAVRVAASQRGTGLGTAMVEWALAEGERRGATLAQLTSDSARSGAHRFYERLGFEASHIGFKRTLGRGRTPDSPGSTPDSPGPTPDSTGPTPDSTKSL